MGPEGASGRGERNLHPLVRFVIFLCLLFLFLVSIKLLGGTIKALGAETASGLFDGVSSPFAALAVGILATVLVQSSSVTTATIVTAVGSGELSVATAVPMIMGANIGTSVTNTIVALGHVRQSREFELAFAGATMHDFFNLIAVTIFLPIEIFTSGGFSLHDGGILTEAAVHLAQVLDPDINLVGPVVAEVASSGWKSPIQVSVKWLTKLVQGILATDPKSPTHFEIGMLFVVALGGIIATLTYITRNMKKLIADRAERALNAALEKSGLIGIVVGIGMTVAVQSSSITTSLLIPMIAAGVLSLRNAFPITLGANIGTTVTALITAIVAGSWGLVIALVHLIFNLAATSLVYPVPAVRFLPVRMAEWLARLTLKNRLYAALYIVITFVVIPICGMLIFKD